MVFKEGFQTTVVFLLISKDNPVEILILVLVIDCNVINMKIKIKLFRIHAIINTDNMISRNYLFYPSKINYHR